MGKALMIQGTGSNVGKSLLVAGLCRYFTRQGLRVLPFKPQNMSNNAAVTADGGEIGRAQALQALACGVANTIHMNPVLLKPESETGAQIILHGRPVARTEAADYQALKGRMMHAVLSSFNHQRQNADLVLVEGAGSPAETNLRAGDIANMGFATRTNVPVILAGDIDRGGVIAQIVGTSAVLSPEDRAMIVGFIVNKFRGDLRLFDDGALDIVRRTGWPNLGVVPWFRAANLLPAEDAEEISGGGTGAFKIAVPVLSRIANFDDLDPLKSHPGVSVQMISPGQPLPGDASLVILCGTKSTIAELAFFRAQGWDVDLVAHIRRGGSVLGLCGGYQMLGKSVSDPAGVEGEATTVPGLGHLDVTTTMSITKKVTQLSGTHIATGLPVTGYEIHVGETIGPDRARAWLRVNKNTEGAVSPDGRIAGSYIHGMFHEDAFRAAFLSNSGVTGSGNYALSVENTLDALADHLGSCLDTEAMLKLSR